MRTPILVTGGTGRLGSLVVSRLRRLGYDVRVLSRRVRPAQDNVEHVSVDLLDPHAPLAGALAGIDTVIHCAGGRTGDEVATRHLVDAARAAGVQRLVLISVVGAERVPQSGRLDRLMFGYFGSKRAAEQVVESGGVPWTILRAAQFQGSFLGVAKAMAKLPVIPVPSHFRFQLVNEEEVAERLVALALGPPVGHVPDLAGPRAESMGDLIREYLRATGRRRLVVSVPTAGAAARAIRGGANLPLTGTVGQQTWHEAVAKDTSTVAALAS